MEITNLLPTSARLDKSPSPMGKGLEGSFAAPNPATEKLAPPGAAPPLIPASGPLGEEGATLEPNAPPQDLDFFPNAETNGLGTPIAGVFSDGDKKAGAGPSDDPECRIGLGPIAIQLVCAMGPIVVAMPPQQVKGEAVAENESKPAPTAPAPPVSVAGFSAASESSLGASTLESGSAAVAGKLSRKLRETVEPLPPQPIAGEAAAKRESKRDLTGPLPPEGVKPSGRVTTPPESVRSANEDTASIVASQFEAVAAPSSPEAAKLAEARKLAAAGKAELRDALLQKAKEASAANLGDSATPIEPVDGVSTPKPASERAGAEASKGKPGAATDGKGVEPLGRTSHKAEKAIPTKNDVEQGSTAVEASARTESKSVDDSAKGVQNHGFASSGVLNGRPEDVSSVKEKSAIELTDRQSSSIIRQVADRLEALAASQTSRKVTIRLEPESLGSITLVVRHEKSDVAAEVFASDDAVRAALAANRPALATHLEQRGIQLNSMTVGNELPNGSGKQEQAMREAVKEQVHFFSASTEASALSLDALRGLTRKATGVDLWI